MIRSMSCIKCVYMSWIVALGMTAVACRPASPPASETRPEAGSPNSSPATAPAIVQTPPPAPPPKPAEPKRPKIDWVIFRSAFDDKADAVCEATWTGGDRFEIKTQNISRITVDLTRLPEGAPAKGPYNFQVDLQGIQLTGFRSKKIDLVRSHNGAWSVDKDAPAYKDRNP